MITRIPSQGRRFRIRLGIHAKRAFVLGIGLYDPYKKHSVYFRRKARFLKGDTHREFIISMAVSPENLEMELRDKDHPEDESAFEVTSFEIEKMPPIGLWATASQYRFLEFAIAFSKSAGHLPVGFYKSEKDEFLFEYLQSITDPMGRELITPARVHRKMPRVQISQKLFKGYTIPIRVAILLHEGCHWFLNTRSQRRADICGIKQYLDYGFPTIEAVYAVTRVFSDFPNMAGDSQLERTKDIIRFINTYKTQ